MLLNLYILKRFFLFVLLIFSLSGLLNAQDLSKKSEHEFTVYVMPTMYPLDWSGPANLYKSMKSCYLKTITLPDNYLLGHVAVGLTSSLLEKELFIAQISSLLQEKLDLIMKQKWASEFWVHQCRDVLKLTMNWPVNLMYMPTEINLHLFDLKSMSWQQGEC